MLQPWPQCRPQNLESLALRGGSAPMGPGMNSHSGLSEILLTTIVCDIQAHLGCSQTSLFRFCSGCMQSIGLCVRSRGHGWHANVELGGSVGPRLSCDVPPLVSRFSVQWLETYTHVDLWLIELQQQQPAFACTNYQALWISSSVL